MTIEANQGRENHPHHSAMLKKRFWGTKASLARKWCEMAATLQDLGYYTCGSYDY